MSNQAEQKAVVMEQAAITERIKLAHAAQKELCAEINRSEDGEFGLGLFDVLQEMYNAGYRAALLREGEMRKALLQIIAICKEQGNRTGNGKWADVEELAEAALTPGGGK